MITTTELFHQKANGGIRPLGWGVGIDFQNRMVQSPQCIVGAGYATPTSETDYYDSMVFETTALDNGWAHIETVSATHYNNAWLTSNAVELEPSTNYSILIELSDVENIGDATVSQSNQTINPFQQYVYVNFTGQESVRIVARVTTKATYDSATFLGLRLFFAAITSGQPASANIRATIVKGWDIPDDELSWSAYGSQIQDYQRFSSRAIGLSVSRSFEFPYNVQSAIADIALDNHDGYLSFAGLNISPIADYILPNRPIQIKYGFKGAGLVPNFTGQTSSMPTYDGNHDSIARFTAMDDLVAISEAHLPNMVMMRDARTDQVLAAIFEQLGIDQSRYSLGLGTNTIPFVYFDSDKSVGNALKELIQAENGRLWQDEEGIIRFTPRQTNVFGRQPVMNFNKSNTLTITPSRDSGIVNQVNISAEIRQIEALQQVFLVSNDSGYESQDDNYRIPANGQATIWLSFDDPVWSCIAPTLNGASTTSNFKAVDLSGTPINSGITVDGTLFATSYKVVFTNTNSSPVSIKSISLFGEPAKLIGGQAVEYLAYDDVSVSKFGTRSLDISDNKCFGSVANLTRYANDIISKRSDYNKQITMTVKGDPSLQLGDLVEVDIDEFQGRYEVLKIVNTIDNVTDSKLETELTLQFTTSSVVSPFILNQSVLDGPDLLG